LIPVSGSPHASLYIKVPVAGQFFLAWFRKGDGSYSPYNGEPDSGYIEDECGGNPFFIPRACLVPSRVAAEVVRYFLETRERSPVATWWDWGNLPEQPKGDS
jgi:Immunity protein Imm1